MNDVQVTLFFFYIALFMQSSRAQEGASGYFHSFDNTKIHYEVQGTGKPVLLIHGFTGTGNDWKNKPIADSLLVNGYKIILVDLRGNGLSDAPDTPEKYADNAEAKDLMMLMDKLGFSNYDAIGYSRGSIILTSLMVLDSHCKRAVLGGMGADFTDPVWPRRVGFYKALMNDTIKGYEGFRTYIAGKGLNPLVLACQQKEQPATSREALAELKQQVLLICGDKDSDNGKGSDLQKLLPHSTFIEIPGTHNTASNTPEFAEQVVTFLRKQESH